MRSFATAETTSTSTAPCTSPPLSWRRPRHPPPCGSCEAEGASLARLLEGKASGTGSLRTEEEEVEEEEQEEEEEVEEEEEEEEVLLEVLAGHLCS